MKSLVLSTIFLSLALSSFATPSEPAGKRVNLNLIDRKAMPSLGVAWKTKGLSEEVAGRYLEALYCFQQAQKSWPLNDPNPALGLPWQKPEQFVAKEKAALFVRMRKPKLALYWSQQIDARKTDPVYRSTRLSALYMLGRFAEAERLLDPGPSIMRASLLWAKNDKPGGIQMLNKAWDEVREAYRKEAQQNKHKQSIVLNLKWMDYPDEVQVLIKKVDPQAPDSIFRF